ncbi:transketolase [Candidatus Pacearchaeota archaeon CG10_big_fil_rev_8_21_14_0_10_31_24]|nr:MAG: transketolase [Candidatus Pacearchaeota archaeon CG10_big_fil_rev_8_21_14_0_10_31_24]
MSQLQDIATLIRRDSIISTTEAGSGHPTSSMSCADILSALFFEEMSYDIKNPDNPDNDEFILSKGHAAPALYSALIRSECIKEDIKSLRKANSNLEGHPMPRSLKWIKVATGSLGQGLSIGVGMALASKLQKRKFRTYVLLGDSELAEGSNYEAVQLALHYKLNNLTAIADINRLGQRGETIMGHDIESYKSRFLGFGWNVLTIEGHNMTQILLALKQSKTSDKPTIILAKTLKGKGVSFLENKDEWHGKSVSKDRLQEALSELGNPKMPLISIRKPLKLSPQIRKISSPTLPIFKIGEGVATRSAYGKSLASLAKSNPNILAVDAEVSNSTYSEEVKNETPEQFIETFIAEQNMIGISLGLSKKGFNPFASTFSAFLIRAHDQIHMASLSSANFTICGSHAGISIGQDGASQMSTEDISFFRSLDGSVIFYPSDANSTAKLVKQSLHNKFITYIRTTRAKTPVIYNEKQLFPIGEFKVLKESKKDKAVLIGSGITLHECLKAHNFLKSKNKNMAVIDLYCIKPLNIKKLISFIKKHGNCIIVSEDHGKAGGIGEMLSSSLANTNIKITSLAVNGIPHSAKPEELLEKHKINWKAIVQAVK